ncbi:SDR family oxidoreductase [Chthonobacter albigriseus]|uniref:SDR family oxidoreductase n=1 Tax=Chthonobacter albigriseus TaxID=1683161 RepID=UPI0015EE4571|nr:SDR family oxidoreductase [Chthonobacter albigriseus]
MFGRIRLRPVRDQVIVITGASSGIGLVTARMAARRGAALVLAARNGEALAAIAEELRMDGTPVEFIMADVSKEEDVHKIAELAIERFGGFDTWVNAAAVAIYGFLDEVPLADHRQLFETNYWGVVYGTLEAVRHLKDRGGAIINIGSVLSEIAVPLQGPYVASKHALKGFTDALRMDIDAEEFPISVSLIKPTSIDTPYVDHARNYLDREPKTPPPRYAPELVARAILYCAENPRREMYVGGAGKAMVVLRRTFPMLFDTVQSTFWSGQQTQDRPNSGADDVRDNLDGPKRDGSERGLSGLGGRELSLYTALKLRPGAAMLIAAVALGAGYCLVQHSRTGRWPWQERHHGWRGWVSDSALGHWAGRAADTLGDWTHGAGRVASDAGHRLSALATPSRTHRSWFAPHRPTYAERSREVAHEAGVYAGDTASRLGGYAGDAAYRVGGYAGDAASRVGGYAGAAASRLGDVAGRALNRAGAYGRDSAAEAAQAAADEADRARRHIPYWAGGRPRRWYEWY